MTENFTWGQGKYVDWSTKIYFIQTQAIIYIYIYIKNPDHNKVANIAENSY